MLLFKKKFLPAIRSGEKTQTIRLWNCQRMRTGQRSYIPGAGYIHVISVEAVDVEQLKDQDAIPDGFATAAELQREIRDLYKDQIASGYQAYRIRFELVPKDWQPATNGKPPRKRARRHSASEG